MNRELPAAVERLIDRLDAEQRAAALLPDGPAQILAPAGSGKTTTLIARLGVLLARGADPRRILVVTFNRDAALELASRIRSRLVPVIPTAAEIAVLTLHALGRRILLERGERFDIVSDRAPLLRAARRRVAAAPAELRAIPDVEAIDTAISAWKLEGRLPAPACAPVVEAYLAAMVSRRALDFDDLITGAVAALERVPRVRVRWQAAYAHVLVDEFQDVDAAQDRLIRLLAAPENNLFVVGDDDQTIYAWRLADVRRMLDFASVYPGAARVTLATNYRCPRAVVEASRRLIGHNLERFPKRISAAPGAPHVPGAIGTLSTGAAGWSNRLAALAARATPQARVCFLARTRGELWPVALALVHAGVPHATTLAMPLDAAPVIELLEALAYEPADARPTSVIERLTADRGWRRTDESLSVDDQAALDALLGWALAEPTVGAFVARCDEARRRLVELRDPEAPVELVTVHGAKGREWETVVLIGWERDRFPNRRALIQASDRRRALEEERRLAYVALTRATRRLVLAYDVARPSVFLSEMLAEERAPQRPTSAATTPR